MNNAMHNGRARSVAVAILVGLGVWLAAGVAEAQTNGNVTWTNGGATVFWNDTGNWVGGKYPTNPTTGKVIYDIYGQAMVGKLETDRTIGGIDLGVGWNASSAGQAHTVDLNGYRLTIAGDTSAGQPGDAEAGNMTLTFTNGTVQIGTDSAVGNMLLYLLYGSAPSVVFKPGTTLDSYRMGTLRIGSTTYGSNGRGAQVDLRGAAVANGVLKVGNVYMACRGGYEAALKFDSTTALSTLWVTNELDVGENAYSVNGTVYFGDPSTYKLPANVNVQVGTSPSARGTRLRIGRGATTTTLTASSNGWFKAYVTDLIIGDPACNGTLDIRAMTNCTIDAVTFTVCKESGTPSATPAAAARLCPGAVTAGTVALGSTVSGGYGLLEMSNTLFTVTNSYTINTTATNLISVGSDSRGLDVQGTFVDGGGKIRVRFMEDPAAGVTNWGVRVTGNAKKTLGGILGAGRLTSTQLVANASKKIGYLYDAAASYSYYALVDTNVTFSPMAIAKSLVTFEWAPAGTVLVGTNDVNNGSFDPSGRTPIALSLSSNGVDYASSLSFTAPGDYTVTLKMEVGSPVVATDTDTCTVRVTNVNAGVTSNLTWKGGASSSLMNRPEWMWSGNWLEGAPPTNPTTATIYYKTSGQSYIGKIEAPRTIGGILVGLGDNTTVNHTLDLGGTTLTLAGGLSNTTLSGSSSFSLTNGTLRIGSGAVEGNLLVGADIYGGFSLQCLAGAIIDTYRVGTVRAGTAAGASNSQVGQIDLRKATLAGGVLGARNIVVGARGTCYIALDGTTTIGAIAVSNSLVIGESGYGGTAYVGNPADAGKRLPANVDIRVGASPSARASVIQIGNNTSPAQASAATLAASAGGTFTAYVTNLTIVPYEATYTGSTAQDGTLDLAGMTNCLIDAISINVARDYAGNNASAQPRGALRLCPGVVTAGTVVVGGTVCNGFGLLALSNTMFTVTNSFTLNTTATNLISLGATPAGLDVQGTFTDGGGKIRISFLAEPAAGTTNWAIRIKGDAQSALNSMIGQNRLTSTGMYAGKVIGVITNGGYTYYAMTDSNSAPALPIAAAYAERTVEMAPGSNVLLHVSEVDSGSYDPAGRTPVALTMSSGGAFASNLTFSAVGDYALTLKIEVGSPVEASNTAACTLHVVNLNPGVTNALTWKGGASTPLMVRREWWWSGNWLEGAPPTNPTTATIYYKTTGQSVTGIVEQSRTIGGLYFDAEVSGTSIAHTLDLGGHTLTLAGTLNSEYYRSWSMRMTNGTLRLGTASQAASLGVGRMGAGTLTLLPGTSLDPVNVSSIYLGEYNSSGSGQALLDLRGCTVVGGALRMANLTLSGYTAQSAFIYLDGSTAISSINVSNNLTFGDTCGGGMVYVGNPADGKLPSNISVNVGVSPSQRGNLVLSRCSNFPNTRTNKLVASSGGSFTAFLANLWISANHAVNATTAQYGLLDISGMNSCAIDVQSLLLAPDHATTPLATDQYQGELRLCPGTAVVATAVIGGSVNAGFGRLVLSNTTFTVTNTITINKTGQMTVNVGAQSCGLVISNAADTALGMATATNGALRIVFRSPAATRPFYGFSWAGNHVAALQAMQSDGRLAVDSAGLAPKTAMIYESGYVTFIGLPPWPGTVFAFR